MKKNITTLLLLVCLFPLKGLTQENNSITTTFIASHGYIIESSSKRIALDALTYWSGDHWGYIKPTVELKEKMENSLTPFDNLDLILISHAHKEHYNSEMILIAMQNNTNASMVLTQEVYDDIVSDEPDIADYNDRIWIPNPTSLQSVDTVINEVSLVISSVPHGDMELFLYSIELDGFKFIQPNSWSNISAETYNSLGFNQTRADIAFLDYDYILNSSKFEIFKEGLNPRFSTLSHIDGATASKLSQIRDKVDQYKTDYPMNLMHTPGDKLLFTKVDNAIKVDTIVEDLTSTIEVINEEDGIRIFPNPVNHSIHVNEMNFSGDQYQIINVKGQIVKQGYLNQEQIAITTLNSGVYWFTLYTEEGIITKRFIVKK